MEKLHHIMIVENEDEIREIVKICLQDLGNFTVTECHSGQEALEKFVETKPQMVLLDVMMPGMNGMTTLEELQKLPNGKDIPIIFVTARAHTVQIKEYLKLGVAGIIAKPFDPITVANELTTIWNEFNEKKLSKKA